MTGSYLSDDGETWLATTLVAMRVIGDARKFASLRDRKVVDVLDSFARIELVQIVDDAFGFDLEEMLLGPEVRSIKFCDLSAIIHEKRLP